MAGILLADIQPSAIYVSYVWPGYAIKLWPSSIFSYCIKCDSDIICVSSETYNKCVTDIVCVCIRILLLIESLFRSTIAQKADNRLINLSYSLFIILTDTIVT